MRMREALLKCPIKVDQLYSTLRDQQIELEVFWRGLPTREEQIKNAGWVRDVVHGKTMKGRVGVVTVPQHKPNGDPVVHIYVEEVYG
ncbi:MAG: hypothetical protein WAK55_26410 [Xanthobacteraceae bacterium]